MKALVCLLGFLLISGNVFAAETGSTAGGKAQQVPAKTQPDSPAKLDARNTSVAVVHDGGDSIGARLATRLKEGFNASNLFRLEEKSAPKLRLLLKTLPEFPGRPGSGSVYSVTWIFTQSDDHLGYLLERELGVVTTDEIDGLSDKLRERTDGIGVKYGYLFK